MFHLIIFLALHDAFDMEFVRGHIAGSLGPLLARIVLTGLFVEIVALVTYSLFFFLGRLTSPHIKFGSLNLILKILPLDLQGFDSFVLSSHVL